MTNSASHNGHRQRKVIATWSPNHERAYQKLVADRKRLIDHSRSRRKVTAWYAIPVFLTTWVVAGMWLFGEASVNTLLVMVVLSVSIAYFEERRQLKVLNEHTRIQHLLSILFVRRSFTHTMTEMVTNEQLEEGWDQDHLMEFDVFTSPDDQLNELGLGFTVSSNVEHYSA